MKKTIPQLLLASGILMVACQSPEPASGHSAEQKNNQVPDTVMIAAANAVVPENAEPADAATVLARKQVPILCYHQIRDWTAKDSKVAKDYIVPVADFKAQLKMLADSGYNTILPDQLFSYLNYGTALPPKPIMLTFDDTDLDQYTVAAPEMKKYGFKGVFFIMTVSLGRPGYMSRDQVRELSDAGHVIGSHTWDHHNVKKYQGEDWVTQIEKPTARIGAAAPSWVSSPS